IVFEAVTLEHLVGLLGRGGLHQAQLRGEAVLQGAPQPLHAPLGLGREGVDRLDLQRPQRHADLGRILLTAKLLGEGPAIVVAPKRSVLVHVDGPRNAVLGDDGLEHAQVPGGALLIDEVSSGQELARGIVDGAHQSQHRPALLEPVVTAAVPKEHQPFLRLAITPPTMPTGTALAHSGDPRLAKYPPYRAHRELSPELLTAKLL